MGNQRFVAGNLVIVCLAILGLLALLPWLVAGLLIIAVAVFASLPVSNRPVQEAEISSKSDSRRYIEQSRQETRGALKTTRPERVRSNVALPKVEGTNEKEEDRAAPKTVPAGDYLSFEVGVHEGEELVADVSADGELNVYVMTEENLNSLDLDQEFWYEAGNERVRNTTVKFCPEEGGTWFLVVENCSSKDVSVTVKYNVNKPSHPVPFLKTEKLDLPDHKLEGKLST
ncbi:hypothetical protein E6H23_08065 [Candidatus Bathyarchaeota archaeon]|nr:MAG: hypothetical protein E6H23_08065 [Candidatus Bathyarchaeota archaeon]